MSGKHARKEPIIQTGLRPEELAIIICLRAWKKSGRHADKAALDHAVKSATAVRTTPGRHARRWDA